MKIIYVTDQKKIDLFEKLEKKVIFHPQKIKMNGVIFFVFLMFSNCFGLVLWIVIVFSPTPRDKMIKVKRKRKKARMRKMMKQSKRRKKNSAMMVITIRFFL